MQSPEALKAAYEDAQNAEGSALKENERYLDSIQGRLDLFTNSVQAMWNNALDSDIVKDIVNIGTEIIKIIDKIGLLNSALVAIASISMIKSKTGPITFFRDLIGLIPKGVKSLQTWVQAMQTSDAATLKNIATKNADTASTAANTAANVANAASSTAAGAAEDKDTVDTVENTAATVADTASTAANTAANVANAASSATSGASAAGAVSSVGGAVAGATTAFTGLAAAIPYVLAAIVAIGVGVAIFNAVTTSTDELKEELDDLNSEISTIESNIDSLNSELQTTQGRMAELLAMPSLSFVEQEELNNLKVTNAELERQLELENALLESKKRNQISTAKTLLNKTWSGEGFGKQDWAIDGNGVISHDNFWKNGKSAKEVLDEAISKYADANDKYNLIRDVVASASASGNEKVDFGTYQKYNKLMYGSEATITEDEWKQYGELIGEDIAYWYDDAALESQKAYMDKIGAGIDTVLTEQLNFIKENGLSYGDDTDVNKYLDEVYAYQYKYQKAQGIDNTSSVISSIFNDSANDSIKNLKESMQDIAGDDTLSEDEKITAGIKMVTDALDDESDAYDRLATSMDIVDISPEEVARYFVQMSEAPDSSTVEGITTQYQKGVEALSKYAGNASDIIAEFTNLSGEIEQITWGSLFDKDGETIDVQISKVLQGADETARKEFARIVKSINEGSMDIDNAITSFSGSGLVAASKLIEESFGELNKSVFKGLEDKISGFIDTFSEFGAALEDVSSSMDLLNAAQEQFSNSGQVSVKTALELVESTDQWNKILYVENGQIKLNSDAQDILVQSKLNTVKANLEEAKSSIQNQLAQLGAADATLLSAEASDVTTEAYTVYTNAMNSYTASIAGFGAAIDALVNGRIIGDDGILASFKSAYNATKEVKTYENNTSIAELRQKLAEVQTVEDFFEGVDTFGEFKDNYDFDKTPGDKYSDSVKEASDDLFQREMDYWENQLSVNQAKRDQIQNEIDLLESQGIRVGEEYYRELIALEKERQTMLESQKIEALKYLKVQEIGSEEWWNAAKIVNDLEGEIDDATAALQDFADAQPQIKWDNLEEITKRFSDLHDEISDLRDILQREDMFDENGDWTESGAAVLGTYVQDLEMYKNELATLQGEIADLQAHPYNEANAKYLKETYSIDSEQEYNDLVTQWNKAQHDLVKGAYDTADAIKDAYSQQVDAIEDTINKQIDAYNDYIDVVKEAYNSERDLYEFKKDIQKQSKSIAETERRIASLSGSTNKADIAERRKLEAQLAEQREDINDTYDNRANDQRSNALDAEAKAYEDSMNRYVEDLRKTLEEQAQWLITFTETGTMATNEFLNGVTATVMQNADVILEKYQTSGLEMSDALKQPWIDASAQLGEYGAGLSVLNDWTSDSGYFGQFKVNASGQLITPFVNGAAAVSKFKNGTMLAMDAIASNVRSNVSNMTSALDSVKSAYEGIKTTAERTKAAIDAANAAAAAGAQYTGSAGNVVNSQPKPTILKVDNQILSKYKLTSDQVLALGYGPLSLKAFEDLLKNYQIKYSNVFAKAQVWNTTAGERSMKYFGANYVSGPWAIRQYAKGTSGIDKDQFAITDEPQFGDELVLVPGKDGNLSFMRKGTGIVPADLTQKLFELAQIPTSDLMSKNLTAVVPNITKNDFKNEFNFDSLVHVDTVDSDTLPKLEKMVDKKIDDFSRALNYSLKKFAPQKNKFSNWGGFHRPNYYIKGEF